MGGAGMTDGGGAMVYSAGVTHGVDFMTAAQRARRAVGGACPIGGGGGDKFLPIALAIAALLLAALTLAQAATPGSAGRYLALDAGGEHQCTLRDDGVIRCWGGNSAELRDVPEGRYAAVGAGAWHNCAIRRGRGEVVCWGSDSNAPDGAFSDVAVGWQFACGVRETSQLECWGTNSFGRSVLDYGQAEPPEGEFSAVSAGYLHACGLRTTGEIVCWGRGSLGRADAPSGVFTQVSSGTTHSCCAP